MWSSRTQSYGDIDDSTTWWIRTAWTLIEISASKCWIDQTTIQTTTHLMNMFLFPKDPIMKELYELMSKYFSIREPKGNNSVLTNDPYENQGGVSIEEDMEEEEQFEEDGVVDPKTLDSDERATDMQDDSPGNDSAPMDDDRDDEQLAFHMGGEEMMKPTPSPKNAWWKDDQPADSSTDETSIDRQIAIIEYFA